MSNAERLRSYARLIVQPRVFTLALHRRFDRLADRYYRINTTALHNLAAPYLWLWAIRRALMLTEEDVLLDVGCGYGRALSVFALSPVRKLYGVDIDKEFTDRAAQNCKSNAKIKVVHGDGTEYNFSDETVVYMYSPFGFRTDLMTRFLRRLFESIQRNPRHLRICYLHPMLDLSSVPQLKLIRSVNLLHTAAEIFSVSVKENTEVPATLKRHRTYREFGPNGLEPTYAPATAD